ncbi:hypothetical protein EVAR_12608_1 [Eumeta japonica]|uniref:Gustatory receptor n=1 Tax=Eumeta variegata TaxID=151549 RepID=A0A4C1UER0_EUMVA|nr:hypothetical protein EVAR_12608_1 [Eumeta japonica]
MTGRVCGQRISCDCRDARSAEEPTKVDYGSLTTVTCTEQIKRPQGNRECVAGLIRSNRISGEGSGPPELSLTAGKPTAEVVISCPYSFFLTAKELFILMLISAACEKVYTRIEELQRTCTVLYEKRIDVALRRAAKNVMRLCSVRHAKMRVFGLFAVDAALPLRLAGLIATYCIVLLQFAFL